MNKSKRTINQMFLIMIIFYITLLLIISSVACYYSYRQKEEEIFSTMDMALAHMDQEYANILENFWQAYMPIYENNSTIYETFQNYFAFTEAADLTPLEKRDLMLALNQMRVRDSRIQWIGLYSDFRKTNYILYNDNTGIKVMDQAFPYIEELQSKTNQMEIYAAKNIENASGVSSTFAICGGKPVGMGEGKIIIGYSLADFENTSNFTIEGLPSIRYYMTAQDQLLFDSSGEYDESGIYFFNGDSEGVIGFQGQRLYSKSRLSGNNTTVISYTISRNEMVIASLKDTPFILSITVLFTSFSIIIHFFMNGAVKREISVIQDGLNVIADNNLDYRLPTDFKQNGLPEIAQNINEISSKLNENIKKAYYFELKQKDAQLAELQATFNPHFLYNTLEMLRSKSYANGDVETSELITQLSALFRGFINAKTFITIREELAFSNRYLTLLSARYGNMVEVSYDIPGELLNYGIIRNVFQLLIENYFVHGFDAGREENYIQFSGRSLNEHAMLLSVEDNGMGMEEGELNELNEKIKAPIRHGETSYGLKNLNQRLKLFYGPDCGLTILKGQHGGLLIQIKLLKMHVEDYESLKV